MTVVAFDLGAGGETAFYDVGEEPVDCVEAVLRARYEHGGVVAVIREAEWRAGSCVRSWYAEAALRDFAVSSRGRGREREKYALDREDLRALHEEILAEEDRRREKALAALVRLPDDFVDRLVARWDVDLAEAERQYGTPACLDDVERMTAVKRAVLEYRMYRHRDEP